MAITKKVYFGSLFEFTGLGAGEVLDGFRAQFPDPEDVPFVSYDKRSKLFSCQVDTVDSGVVALLKAQIDTYTTLHGIEHNEPLESDRLIPIAGTAFRDEVRRPKTREKELIPMFDIDDSSTEDEKKASEGQDVTWWTPRLTDASILPVDIAEDVADKTGTFLIPDTVGQKTRLVHGNVPLALQRLKRLEGVLIFASPHRSKATSNARPNVSLQHSGPDSTIRFVRPVHPHCGFDRIVLERSHIGSLHRALLGEIRLWQKTKRVKPLNLDLEDVSLTAQICLNRRFSRYSFPTLGVVQNAKPRLSSSENSQLSGEVQRPPTPTKFLGHKEAERVEEWRGNIDPDAAPTLPPEEPAADDDHQPKGRRRVVMEYSDESEDDEAEIGTDTAPFGHASPEASFEEVSVVQASEFGQHASGGRSKGERVRLSTQKGHRDLPKQNRENTWIDKGKGACKSPAVKSRFHNSNRYEVIEDEESESQEQDPDGHTLALQNTKNKPLNVSFREKEPQIQPPSREKTSLSPQKSHHSSSSFDASKYGVKRHIAKSRTEKSQGRSDDLSVNQAPRRPSARPRGGRFNSSPTKQNWHNTRNIRQENVQNLSWRRHKDLIDISMEESSGDQIAPPPGFDYRTNENMETSETVWMSPERRENSSPTHRLYTDEMFQEDLMNISQSTGHRGAQLDFNPQYTVPRRNINYLQEQALARLRADMEAKNDDGKGKEQKGHVENRVEKHDEYSTRKYHRTMSQKMTKPDKTKKSGNKHETKAEKEARIAKAKADAYGDTNSAKPAPGPAKSQAGRLQRPEDMTAKKRQILKQNQAMADLHQDAVADSAAFDAANKVIEELKPVLEATRAFKGVIKVEIQLGQALILKNSRIDEKKLYTLKEWAQLLNDKSNPATEVIFTNILTTNGEDIERMIEIKAETKSSRLWDVDGPDPITTTFEFSCQDKSGREFLLTVDQDGEYSLVKEPTTITKMGLHAPSQIWDACLTVSGTMKVLRPSEDVLAGVEQFRESLYTPGGTRAVIYYRLPQNNSFTITGIIVRRVSVHNCLLPDRENIQMRITEVKALANSSNPTDKKLYRSYESSYAAMVNEGRIHYEVAIIDKSVEDAFKANPDIEIGELAPVTTPDGNIINFQQTRGLIEVTTYMLERIDWAGAHNIGTMKRLHEHQADYRASLANTVPPNLNYNLPIPMGTTAPATMSTAVPPTTYQSQYSRTAGGANTNTNTNTQAPEPVLHQLHGVRANTAAELYRDRTTGEFFYYGQGGARIPVVNEQQLENPRFDGMGPIVPGDSASQIGDVRKNMPGNGGFFGGGNSSSRMKGGWDDKPAGFW